MSEDLTIKERKRKALQQLMEDRNVIAEKEVEAKTKI